MTTLTEWLREQFDEDERIARAASWTDDANAWHADPSPYGARDNGQRWYVEDAMEEGVVSHVDPRASDDEGVARHIAEWDPARVLREIDAKRRLLADLTAERHEVVEGCWYTCTAATEERDGGECCDESRTPGPCNCGRDARVTRRLHLLALPYTDRPGYREEWRP